MYSIYYRANDTSLWESYAVVEDWNTALKALQEAASILDSGREGRAYIYGQGSTLLGWNEFRNKESYGFAFGPLFSRVAKGHASRVDLKAVCDYLKDYMVAPF